VNDAPLRTELKNLSVLDTNFRDSFRGGNVFGLGPSRYSPGSRTATVKVYTAGTTRELPPMVDFTLPGSSPTLTHEFGHSVLTDYTMAGMALERVEALKKGLCLVIVRKMLEHHGRVWIPLTRYSPQPGPNPHISRLIRALDNLADLEKRLFDGWKVNQETFAFAFMIFFCGAFESIMQGLFHTDDRVEMARMWGVLALLADDDLVAHVAERLQVYCTEKDIDWSKLDRKTLLKLAQDADKIFSENSETKAIFLGWLEATSRFQNEEEPGKCTEEELFRRVQKEIAGQYSSSGNEHLQALNTLLSCGDSSPARFLIPVAVAAMFFTPKVSPASLLEGNRSAVSFGSIDQATEMVKALLDDSSTDATLAGVPFAAPLDCQKARVLDLLRSVIRIQRELNWVTFRDRKVQDREICGTEDWLQEVVRLAATRRRDRKLLARLTDGLVSPEILHVDLSLSRVADTLCLLPIRILFRPGLFIAGRLRRRFRGLDVCLSVLDELGMTSARSIGRLLRRYGNGMTSLGLIEDFSSLGRMQGRERLARPPAICRDGTGLRLVLPGNGLKFLARGYSNYLLSEFSDICVDGKRNYTLVCPYGRLIQRLEGSSVGLLDGTREKVLSRLRKIAKDCGPKHQCEIKQTLATLNIPGSLICGYGNTAEHLRCFGGGRFSSCGKIPFEVMFGVDTEEEASKQSLTDDTASRFREMLRPPVEEVRTRPARVETSKKTSEKKTFREIRAAGAAKLEAELLADGYSRAKVRFTVVLYNFGLLALDAVERLVMLVIEIPANIIRLAALLVWRAVTFPQRKMFALRRRRRIQRSYKGWDCVTTELRDVFRELSQCGGRHG